MTAGEFATYHADHPELYDALQRFALEAHAHGRTRLGIKMLIERVRWYTTIEQRGEFKINNSAAPFYARKLMRVPALRGMFALRQAAADQGGLWE
jgi:hypothetical protein